MEQNLQIVKVEGVRGYVDKNSVAWLNVEDVARGLGFVKTEEKFSTTSGRNITYETVRWARVNGYLKEYDYPSVKTGDFIPENIFYLLAMKASNEAAKNFQLKIANEILPSIRRHGFYATESKIDEIVRNPDRFIEELMTAYKRVKTERDAALLQAAELKPKADYCEKILQSPEALNVTVIAKDYGMGGAMFNQLLYSLKIQYPVGRTWVLYQDYVGKGYTVTETVVTKNGGSATQMKWTQRGRNFIYNFLKKHGELPLCEQESPMATLFGATA